MSTSRKQKLRTSLGLEKENGSEGEKPPPHHVPWRDCFPGVRSSGFVEMAAVAISCIVSRIVTEGQHAESPVTEEYHVS